MDEPSNSAPPRVNAGRVVDTPPVPQTIEEVHQQPPKLQAITVRHDGPIESHELPARAGAHTIDVVPQAPAAPVQVAGRDMRRKRLVLISADNPFYFGDTVAGVQQGRSGRWPSGVPLEIRHADPVWILCASANSGDTSMVTSFVELWAD